MFDIENPEGYNTQAEFSPEFDAVRGTDDGFSCGGDENDGIMKLLQEFGY